LDQRQVGDAHEAELADEGQRLIAALLLGEAGESMLAGVIDADPAILLDGKAARPWEKGVSQVILGARGSGTAELGGPPLAGRRRPRNEQADPAAALRLRLSLSDGAEQWLAMQEAGKLVAKGVDAMLKALVEHVADHDHSAFRPLSYSAEIGMVELRLASIALSERAEQGDRGVKAYPVALGDIGHDAKPFRR